jgi:hypothetical protein
MPTYLIKRCKITLYMSIMDVRINQRWSTALEVLVQDQSLTETGQSLAQSIVH